MRGKRTRVTPAIEAYVRDRRRQGLSHRAICVELEQMGTPLSLGACHKIAPASSSVTADGRVLLNVDAKPDGARVAPEAATEATEAAPMGIPDDADMATLEALQAKWQAMSEKAEAAGNLSGFIALQRLLRDVVTQKRKIRPPPVEKPEDNPDFVAAGQRAAERLHRLVDEALRAVNETRREVA
jgi:hypothetical protein